MIDQVIDLRPAAAPVQMGFDYRQIEEQYRDDVKVAAQTIRAQGHAMRKSILTIGRRLVEVKGMLPHGVFGEWITAEFGMSERMSQNIMNVAREYEGKSEIVSFLSDTVLYLLAAPSTPEEARIKVEEAALNGEKIDVAFARQVIRGTKRAQVERLRQPGPAPTPTPAKAVYVEAEPQPAPAAGDDGAYGMFAREWVMMRLTAANPQSNDFQIALFQLATPDDLREALTAQDTGGKFVAERTLAIHNRLREMVAVKPEPWTPNRVDETKRGMELLQQTRAWLREQYGDLTGRHTLLLPWERATEAVLEPLESLIEALSPQEETA